MYNFGTCCQEGTGVQQDLALAVHWFRKAAGAGYADAMNQLGRCYRDGLGVARDLNEAVRWFRRASEAGDTSSMWALGTCYRLGLGVPLDDASAATWFRKAADAGDEDDMLLLSDCYAEGRGVPQNTDLAAEWCRKAVDRTRKNADSGQAWAVARLGNYHLTGTGMQPDFDQAVHWYRRALVTSKDTNSDAMVGLGMCYLEGHGVAKSAATALEWFRKAKHDSHAMVALGRCYERGLGVAADWDEAARWFREAGDRGTFLGGGLCYWHGLGVPKDMAKARGYVECSALSGRPVARAALADLDAALFATRRAAAEGGDNAALAELGVMYERGRGVARNPLQALACFLGTGDAAAAERVRAAIAADRDLATQQTARRKRGVPDDVRDDTDEPVAKARRVEAAKATERRERGEHAAASADVAEQWRPTRLALADCPACLQRIGRGQSVLLKECLHALCRACTTHMLERATPFACPVCEVPASPAADLPQHPLVESISAAAAGPLARECTNCLLLQDGDGGLAEFTCATCNRWLCDDHARRHRKAASTAAHALEPVPSGTGAPAACKAHGLPFEAYCDTCRTVVCTKCLTTTHPLGVHATRIVDDAFVAAYRTRLTAGAAAARTAADEMVQRAADVALALSEVGARDAALRTEMNRSVDALIQILEARRAALDAELDAVSRAEQAALIAAREADAHRWRLLDAAVTIAEQVAASPIAVLVQLEPAATARTAAAVASAPVDPVPFAAPLRLDLGDADQYLSRLGRIVAPTQVTHPTQPQPQPQQEGGGGPAQVTQQEASGVPTQPTQQEDGGGDHRVS